MSSLKILPRIPPPLFPSSLVGPPKGDIAETQ